MAAVGTNNMRLACYDDNAGAPNNVLAQTNSIPMTADYSWKSIPEFALTTQQAWTGFQYDVNTGVTLNRKTGLASGTGYYKNQAYGAFESPLTSPTAMTMIHQSKIGHS